MNEFDLEPYMDDSMPQNLVMLMLVQLYLTQQQGFPRFFVILLFVSLVIYPIPSLFGIFPSFKLKKKLVLKFLKV
jgi:hypothetical protein